MQALHAGLLNIVCRILQFPDIVRLGNRMDDPKNKFYLRLYFDP